MPLTIDDWRHEAIRRLCCLCRAGKALERDEWGWWHSGYGDCAASKLHRMQHELETACAATEPGKHYVIEAVPDHAEDEPWVRYAEQAYPVKEGEPDNGP